MVIFPEDVKVNDLYKTNVENRSNTSLHSIIDYPNHFASDKDKKKKTYIKTTIDYYAYIARQSYDNKYKDYKGNYDLLNGIISAKDLYHDTKEMLDHDSGGLISLLNSAAPIEEQYRNGLPDHVQHYSIMTQPVNTILGEASKRPDLSRPKAVDEQSKSEFFQYLTSLASEMIESKIRQRISSKYQNQIPQDNSPESQQKMQQIQSEIDQKVMEEYDEKVKDYSSVVEKWASVMSEACKIEFNMKEQTEIGLKDLLASSGEFYHIKETNTDTGFNTTVLNTLSTWGIMPKDEKYTKNSEACGYVTEMSMNELLKEFSFDEDEMKVLRDDLDGNRVTSTGPNKYSAHFIPANEESLRFPMASEVFNPIVPPDNNRYYKLSFAPIDRKRKVFTVHIMYWEAFKKVGKLVCLEPPTDPDGIQEIDPLTGEPALMEVTRIVDENYKSGSHPYEISIEWTYDVQIYKGAKIGDYVYKCEEFNFLPYMPIIGVIHNSRNSLARSFVDMLKPFQSLYNLLINQMWSIANKDFGIQVAGNARHIPGTEDGDNKDAVEDFVEQMHEEGLLLTDDSIKNTKIATQNTNPFRVINASRAEEMMSRIQLAQLVKEEALALVGINRQRLGTVLASDTVGGLNTATSQSYAQTEPIFIQHEYLLNQVNQAIIDAALYIVSTKPDSSLLFINEDGDNEYIRISSEVLRGRDIKLFFSSRGKDAQAFQALQNLSQAYLQNGGDIYDVSLLYTTNSIRFIQDMYKKLKVKRIEMEKRNQEMQQQQIENQRQAQEQAMQLEEQRRQEDLAMERYKIETESNTRIAVAQIGTYFKDPGADVNTNGMADISEIAKMNLENQKALSERYFREQDNRLKQQEQLNKADLERMKLSLAQEELQVRREENATNFKIAKENQTKAELSAKKNKK